MASETGFSTLGKLYLWSVIAAGLAIVIGSIYELYVEPIGNQWFILAALTLVSGSATVKLPSTFASISISETFTFTAVLLYGPAAGTAIVALDGLVGSFWLSKRHREAHRALFNMSAPALSAWCSAKLFFAVAGIAPLVKQPSPVAAILPALVLFALTYFTLNSWLIAFVISLERHINALEVWKSSFGWLSLNYFGGASVAFLLVGYNRTINLGYVGAITPLLLVLYFTFKAATGRVEDANRHVEQLNRLYLSTIETLAMAIDAKDQVTHGHIRRVQKHAIALAHKAGVHDEKLLRAIEAAALLHDMGKLAVPEHILNKPGKLTDKEFEKMKLHASVGADILSAIDFPYPVVPIVRHHHENWDGTGYPSGLKGTDIPIGARILSVVDCFDALTSDRPYRPRLSDDDAVQILLARRGTMYDPMIVDTFVKIHSATQKEEIVGRTTDLLNTIAHSRRAPRIEQLAADERVTSANEMLSVYGVTAALAGHATIGDACDIIARHLSRLIPSSTCVFFIYDQTKDELKAAHVFGEGRIAITGISIQLGQRLSGWVAANRQSICASDAGLDLDDLAQPYRLKTCVSAPLVWRDELLGVVTLYGNEQQTFSEDHGRVLDAAAHQIAHTFRRAIDMDTSSRCDRLTGLPHTEQLEKLILTIAESESFDNPNALLFIEVGNLERINAEHGRAAGDDVLRHVVRQVRAGLRIADILFRNSGNDFVAFLGATNTSTANAIAERIRDLIARNPAIVNGRPLIVEITVTAAATRQEGLSLREVFALAKQRHAAQRAAFAPLVH
jgi:diguanylate cyclase (GGDEF)-like protein/putative nucleotidyltransferase with HDIG domain